MSVKPIGEITSFQHLCDGYLCGHIQHIRHIHSRQPLGVVPDLETVRKEHFAEARQHRLSVTAHLIGAEPATRLALAGGIANLRREIADDQNGGVSCFLELSELPKHYGPAKCHSRRGWVHPQLDPQRPALCQTAFEVALGKHGIRSPEQ